MFGPQAIGLAQMLAEKVTEQVEEPTGNREGWTAFGAEDEKMPTHGLVFREFLIWARRLREAEVKEYQREFKVFDADRNGTSVVPNSWM